MNKNFKIEGMTCASCVSLIETETMKLAGIESVNVSFSSEIANLSFNKDFDEALFLSKLNSLGYRAFDENEKVSKKNVDLLVSIFLLLMGSALMLGMFFIEKLNISHASFNAFQLIICSIIFLFYAPKYLLNLWQFFSNFISNMHTLIGLGIITNLVYSFILFFSNPHAHLFVEGVPFILGFTLLGQYFERLAKTKAKTSLSELYKLQIKFATLLKNDSIENVPVIDLAVGDVIRIKPGEKIPVKGTIIKGESHLDESLITGESLPITKKIGDQVISGSLNLEGTIEIKLDEVFHDSSIQNIINFIEKAETKKTHIELIAQKIIRFFVPAIIAIAVLTFISWFLISGESSLAVKYFISVLVIACPCALGLAVPISVMIATREAARLGLLIDGGEVFEIADEIDTIVLDKTGTLTIGHPEVKSAEFYSTSNLDDEKILSLVASSCSYSNHPLSLSVVSFAKLKNASMVDPDKFKNIPGKGFSSQIGDHLLLVGSRSFLEENNIEVKKINSNEISSKIYVSINNIHQATFYITDKIKPNAIDFINYLKSKNIEVWVLSGDNEATVKLITQELGIDHYKANVSPNEKSNFILELKDKKKKVAMVGDGVNDAQALSVANLSIAMSNGSDIAISSANVSVLDGDLLLIKFFFNLSKKTNLIIKQNLFFSFFYNILCIPLAAGVFVKSFGLELDPKWASLSMGLSSTSVILSSMRLKKIKELL